VSTFSIGPGKYFRAARSTDLQISSASAEGEQFAFTVLLHANAGKYFRTACSNDLQMSCASTDGEQFALTVSPPANGGDDAEGNEQPLKRKRTRSRLFVGRG
jgi:hypothetical protein